MWAWARHCRLLIPWYTAASISVTKKGIVHNGNGRVSVCSRACPVRHRSSLLTTGKTVPFHRAAGFVGLRSATVTGLLRLTLHMQLSQSTELSRSKGHPLEMSSEHTTFNKRVLIAPVYKNMKLLPHPPRFPIVNLVIYNRAMFRYLPTIDRLT